LGKGSASFQGQAAAWYWHSDRRILLFLLYESQFVLVAVAGFPITRPFEKDVAKDLLQRRVDNITATVDILMATARVDAAEGDF
jgi:hypothetical protein